MMIKLSNTNVAVGILTTAEFHLIKGRVGCEIPLRELGAAGEFSL